MINKFMTIDLQFIIILNIFCSRHIVYLSLNHFITPVPVKIITDIYKDLCIKSANVVRRFKHKLR